MLGCIGVAPAGDFAPTSGPSGPYGGNLDYNRIGEGATVYLPVYHPGGLLFVGDGHALQADGEPTGTGIETSMDVEFVVEVKKKAGLTGPRVETADEIISIGSQAEFASALDNGLKMATTDMVEWLVRDYGMEPWAAHLLIGYQGKYDVVTVAGSMALRLPKKVLAARDLEPDNRGDNPSSSSPACPPRLARWISPGFSVPSSSTSRPRSPPCHASTIAETTGRPGRGLVRRDGRGGSRRGHLGRRGDDGKAWTPPVEVADGGHDGRQASPVLEPGPVPAQAAGRSCSSTRSGRRPRLVGDADDVDATAARPGRAAPAPRRHPRPDQEQADRARGRLDPLPLEHRGPRAGASTSSAPPTSAGPGRPIGAVNDGKTFDAIQPTILTHPDGRIQALCRSRQAKIVETWSADGGKTWSTLAATALPNPNSRHRRRHPRRRPPPAGLQPHHQGPHAR